MRFQTARTVGSGAEARNSRARRARFGTVFGCGAGEVRPPLFQSASSLPLSYPRPNSTDHGRRTAQRDFPNPTSPLFGVFFTRFKQSEFRN